MALSNPVLAELADHFGIAQEFWDWKGRRTTITDETAIAILAALEVDASTPELAEEAVHDVRQRPWRRALPPCTVVEQGHSAWVNVHVPGGDWAHLQVRTEDGALRDARQVSNDNPDRDIDGQWTGEATFQLPDDLPLGYHRLVLHSPGREVEAALIVTPTWVGFPRAMGERRVWGYATQLYSVCSRTSWGVGDLTDLADLAVWSATQQYADYVLVNPLHAAQPTAQMEPSPYLPASRTYVNPIYIRPEAIPEFAALGASQRRQVETLRLKLAEDLTGLDQVRRDESWQAKTDALEVIFAVGMAPARQMAFHGFRRREGRPLRDFATWCCLFEQYGPDWHEWPTALQRPTSPEVAEFHRANAKRIEFYEWLQWLADQQVSGAQQAAKDAGMRVGIVADLAVGVNANGADTWMMPDVFARGVTVGAPPDQFNQTGQDWGQPPWRPDRLADLAYAPFRQMVSGALRHAGGIRVDHIIGMFRLWWVPQGLSAKEGCYVRYDHEALIGILALEAYRLGALVIGEDLGTVEPMARDYLRRRGLLGTSVLWFEADEAGDPLPAERWRELCMASVTTHDLPPSAGYLAGDHIRLRARLGLLTEGLDEELAHARHEQRAWLQVLVDRGLLDPAVAEHPDSDVEQIVLAMHRFLTLTPSRVLSASLTDAVGDRVTQNQPGTIDEYPNWRMPLTKPDGGPMLLEEVYASDRAMRLSAVMNGFGRVPAAWSAETPNR